MRGLRGDCTKSTTRPSAKTSVFVLGARCWLLAAQLGVCACLTHRPCHRPSEEDAPPSQALLTGLQRQTSRGERDRASASSTGSCSRIALVAAVQSTTRSTASNCPLLRLEKGATAEASGASCDYAV